MKDPGDHWATTRAYYGWDLSAVDFKEVLSALWEADLERVRAIVEAHPELTEADGLLHTAARPPGHWHHGHGGEIPADVGRDEERAAMCRYLVEAGVDVNLRSRRRRDTALHAAARYGLKETARTLLELGADPNVKAKGRATAILRAARLGYRPVYELLLEHGADPEIAETKGATATSQAKKHGWL
jgi:ankyrin repeat protein